MDQPIGRFEIRISCFSSGLPPYLRKLYQDIISGVQLELHPDARELADVMLGFLPVTQDEILGFLSLQAKFLLESTNTTCQLYNSPAPTTPGTPAPKLPSLRLMLCDKRYLKLNNHSSFYDIATNRELSEVPYFPLNILSFAMVPAYANLLKLRQKGHNENLSR